MRGYQPILRSMEDTTTWTSPHRPDLSSVHQTFLFFFHQDAEESKAAEAEDTTENELSDPEEDDLTDSQQTNKLSELYSTTIPSVDSAMESWDGSGLDAGYGSQGKLWINTGWMLKDHYGHSLRNLIKAAARLGLRNIHEVRILKHFMVVMC